MKGRAEDSLVVTPNGNLSYFYNQAQVDYQDIGIRAGYIQIDWATNEALATGIIDSTGSLVQRPIFLEGGKEYRTDTIRYNFESKKARIKKVITKEGEGYLHGERVKKMENVSFTSAAVLSRPAAMNILIFACVQENESDQRR